MKFNRFIWAILAFVLLVTMACNVSIPRGAGGSVRGSGNVVSTSFDVDGFDAVSLLGTGNLHVVQGDNEELRVEAEDNIIDVMDIRVQGNTLELGWEDMTSVRPTRPIDYYLTVETLEDVRLSGSGEIQVDDLNTDQLTIVLAGSGTVEIENLDADSLEIDVPGSGEIEASGEVENLDINIRGSADYYGRDLDANSGRLRIFGSGNALLNVSDELNITIAGSGTVRYLGNPQINQSVTGSGSVRQEQ
jgi:hypothetical protein